MLLEFLKSVNPLVWLAAGFALFLGGLALAVLLILRGNKRSVTGRERPQEHQEQPAPVYVPAYAPVPAPSTQAYTSSIIGNRSYQQDYALTFGEDIPAEALAQKGRLALVCDGMGGMQGGERASRCCAELIMQGYYDGDYDSPAAFYAAQIPVADSAVHALENAQGEPLGGGTTLVAAAVKDGRAYCANVGDSRIYLYRTGELVQLTRDHNYFLRLSQMVREGDLTMEEAMADPQREALISYIGMGTGPDIIDIDEEGFPVEQGDLLLLCSDGLYKAMSQEEIRQIITDNLGDVQALPGVLTAAAFSKGWIAHDNITVVIVSCAP